MRFLLAILIGFSLCFQCCVQLGIVGWYELNKQSITEKYCINKDKPQLHCNGKCHLKKQLKQTKGDESSKDQNSSRQMEWTVFIIPEIFQQQAPFFPVLTNIGLSKQDEYSFVFLHTIFHPPQLA